MRNEREFLIEQILAQRQDPEPDGPAGESQCPDDMLLMACALDQAPAEKVREVDEHCATCADCRTRLAAYREFVNDLNVPEPPYEGSLLERMAERREFVPKRPRVPEDSPPPSPAEDDSTPTGSMWEEMASGPHDLVIPEPSPEDHSEPQPATDTAVAQGTVLSFTQLARNPALWPDLLARLAPWLPFLLRRVGMTEDLAGDFLTFLRGQLPRLGERRFREALPGWLEAFSRERASGASIRPEALTIDPAFISAAAVEQAIGYAAAQESPWAGGIRSQLRQMGLPTPADLLSVQLLPELTRNPALPGYLGDLFAQARRAERAGLELFELVTAA